MCLSVNRVHAVGLSVYPASVICKLVCHIPYRTACITIYEVDGDARKDPYTVSMKPGEFCVHCTIKLFAQGLNVWTFNHNC